MNQISLQKKVLRQIKSIQSSAYRNRALDLIVKSLSRLHRELQRKELDKKRLSEIEVILDSTEQALVQQWINVPYNEILFNSPFLKKEEIENLRQWINKDHSKDERFKLIYSRMA